METNASQPVVTPWFIHPSHVICDRYVYSMLSTPRAYVDNLISLRYDHRRRAFDGPRAQNGVVKPRAIRFSNLQWFVNPLYPEHQTIFPSDLEEHRDHNMGLNIDCVPQPMPHLMTQSRELCTSFPYMFSCLSSFQYPQSATTLETESIFREILRGQMSSMQPKNTSYHKSPTCSIATDAARSSNLHPSPQSDHFKRSYNHWQIGRASPRLVLSKRVQETTSKVHPGTRYSSTTQKSDKHQICVQKLKQKALNNFRKHFQTPLTTTISKEFVKTTRLESIKADIAPLSSAQMKKQADNSKNIDTCTKSPADTLKGREMPVPLVDLNCYRGDHISEVCETRSPNDNNTRNTSHNAMFYSQQPSLIEDKKTFKCPQCRYLTDRKNNLKRHILTMHQASIKSLECCGISFQNKAALRDHNSIFHRGGYRCQTCSRNFCRKALLRRHLAVHSGQKDFFCSVCGYATSHKSNLERHQKVHMKKEPMIGDIRYNSSRKKTLRLGSASVLSRAILNSRLKGTGFEETGVTSPMYKYGPSLKSLQSEKTLNQMSSYQVLM